MITGIEHDAKLKPYIIFTIVACVAVYVLGMMLTIMEIDAAQYASISDQILHNNSFLEIKHRHYDYLDKPPLLFWLSAISIKLFGVNSFAFKVPSVLSLLLATFSIYKFSKIYYNRHTALMAAIILLNCQAFYIMAHDCRTDNLLIGFSCFAIWQITEYIENRQLLHLALGFVGIGFAMLAKGPLGLIFPGFTLAAILFTKNNISALNWKWIIGLPIIGLILLPMSIGLYTQHGVEGLEFFYWKQSFGRITGESEWKNDTDPFFLVHTFLWSFLPFTILFICAFFNKISRILKKNLPVVEFGSIAGFLLTMLALSMSKYKLPHYIYIVMPLAAVISARYIFEIIGDKASKIINNIQLVFLVVFIGFSIFVITFFNGYYPMWLVIPLMVLLFVAWKINKISESKTRMILLSALVGVFINLQLNTSFYPKLLTYQSSSEVAFFVKDKKLDISKLNGLRAYGHALSYYLDTIVPFVGTIDELKNKNKGDLFYAREEGIEMMRNSGLHFRIVKEFDEFSVTLLTPSFLNPDTRDSATTKAYLLEIVD